MWRWVGFLLLIASAVAQTGSPAVLDFDTRELPAATAGRPYSFQIKMKGSAGPYEFRVSKGALPAGLTLFLKTGLISGVPDQVGTFRFAINVLDTNTRASVERDFVLVVKGPLSIEWVDPPTLTDNTIAGSVKVSNSSSRGDTFDLTVIIVAVNEYGKAFALGYQHFELAESVQQVIPFGSTVPNGKYIVHADAIAEIPARQTIYRARLQTQVPLVVDVNR